jgi:aryl-alcohol dehydrogenase-like predicted oxidoreductase
MTTATPLSTAQSTTGASKLGLGTVQFGVAYGVSNTGGQVALPVARAIVERARHSGMRLIDTAPAYGTSEAVVGQLVGHDPSFIVSTKTVGGGAAALAAGLEASAEKLRRRPLEIVLIHDTATLLGPDGTQIWAALRDAKDAGLVSRIGISAYFEQNPRALAERFRPDVMQLPISMLDQRLVCDGSLERLAELGIEIHARSIFLQGLPFLSPAALPPKLAHSAGRLSDIKAEIEANGSTMVEALTGFVIQCRFIAVALVGVTSVGELDAIARAAHKPFEGLDWSRLRIDDPLILSPMRW